ncbi:unnamed protein product [Ectocarpus fasciculatus]
MHRRGRSASVRVGGVVPRRVTTRMTLMVATALCLVVFSEYVRTKSAPSVDGVVISASRGRRGTGGVRHPSTLAATTVDGPREILSEHRSVTTEQRSVKREATNKYLRGREARQQDRRNNRNMRPGVVAFPADPKERTDRRGSGDEKEVGAVGMEENYNSMAVAAAEAAEAAAAAMMQKGREHMDVSYAR